MARARSAGGMGGEPTQHRKAAASLGFQASAVATSSTSSLTENSVAIFRGSTFGAVLRICHRHFAIIAVLYYSASQMISNSLDVWVMSATGSLTHRSEIIDLWIEGLKGNELLKGGVVITVFWWLWFGPESKIRHAREVLLATLFGALAAAAAARLAVITLPFRLRPLHEPSLHYQLPFGTSPEALDGMSSFPSDHAAVFFGLAAGLLFLSRPLGLAMLGYVALFIAAPRIYTGMHYPTDILAGAFIGVTFATLANYFVRQSAITGLALRWLDKHPASFYSAFFLLSFQVATLFDGSRGVASVGYRTLRLLVR